jgi:hypothetical protein
MDGVLRPEADLLDRFDRWFEASALTPWALARAIIDKLILSVCAACCAAPSVHSLAQSSAFLIESARRLPAVRNLVAY